jgi:hypothetical protein
MKGTRHGRLLGLTLGQNTLPGKASFSRGGVGFGLGGSRGGQLRGFSFEIRSW